MNYSDIYQKIKNKNNGQIAYNQVKFAENDKPVVIYVCGYASDKESSKAVAMKNYCIQNEIDYIRYDNTGLGESDGDFTKATISTWYEDLVCIIEQLVDKNFILIGSSMGGWISTLAALAFKDRIKAMILISPSLDFTEDLLAEIEEKKLTEDFFLTEVYNIEMSYGNCSFYKDFLLQGSQNLLLNKEYIQLENLPIRILQGMKDDAVDYNSSLNLITKFKSENVQLILFKDGDHRLSEAKYLRQLEQTLYLLIEGD